jgi:hypothetical protein
LQIGVLPQETLQLSGATSNGATPDFYRAGAIAKGLFKLENSVAYNSAVDLDVGTIDTDSECTRAQIVYVLTASNSEVCDCVGGAGLNGLVDSSGRRPGRSSYGDSRRRQCARGFLVKLLSRKS